MAAHVVTSRIRATQSFLATMGGTRVFEGVVKTQTSQLLQLMQRSRMSSQIPGECAALIRSYAGWPNEALDELLEQIAQLAGGVDAPTSFTVGVSVRLALQDYTALVNYIPQKFYRDGCQSDDVMKLARLLGLRHPSEPSVQACTALYLGFDMGLEAALTLSGEQRFAAYKIVRNTLKSKAAVEPPRQIQTLPSEPATFKESYPDMWAAAYGTIDSPQITPGHLRIRFNELTAAIPMRCTHSSTAACRLRLLSGASTSERA
jgi:hypothetical protein